MTTIKVHTCTTTSGGEEKKKLGPITQYTDKSFALVKISDSNNYSKERRWRKKKCKKRKWPPHNDRKVRQFPSEASGLTDRPLPVFCVVPTVHGRTRCVVCVSCQVFVNACDLLPPLPPHTYLH